MAATSGHATLAQAARERRDIVTGEVMAEARLIRFVAGPGGTVAPDLARKLPGRGLWVAADRASVERAAVKGLFARAAKAPLTAPRDLADTVESLLLLRLLAALGLARKSGGGLPAGSKRWRRRWPAARRPTSSRRPTGRAGRTAVQAASPPAGESLRASRVPHRSLHRRRIEFGLGSGECDTHRLPCRARRSTAGQTMSSGYQASVRSFLRVGARSLERGTGR